MAVYELYDLFSKSDKKITYSDEDMPFRIVDRTYPSGSDKITFVTYAAVCTAADKKADLRGWNGDDGQTPESTTSVFGWPGILWLILVFLAVLAVAIGTGVHFKRKKGSED